MLKENQLIEISISDIIRFIRKYFFFLIVVGIAGCIAGYLLSFLYQKEYKVTARLLPEQLSSPGGGLNQLASLAGISMRTRTEAVRPDLYPDILSSNQFIIKLLNVPLKDQSGSLITLFEFFNLKRESDEEAILPFTKDQIEGVDSILDLTREQQILIKNIKSRSLFSYGKLDGVVSLEIELPDPVLASGAVKYSIDYLIDFVTSYRTEKADLKIRVLEDQVSKAGDKYRQLQVQFNSYRDSNRNTFTFSGRGEAQRLEFEFQRAQALYSELLQQLEVARLQKEEDTPIIKVLDTPVVPYKTSKPRRLIMALIFGIIVVFFSIIYLLSYKEKWGVRSDQRLKEKI